VHPVTGVIEEESIMIKRLVCAAAVGLAATLPSLSLAQASAAASPHTLSGNLTLVSDYRFRGISQTLGGPAVQAGLDYGHASGLYLGNWNSNVSGVSFPNGAGVEMDFYGGWRGEVGAGLTLDVGGVYYLYPGTRVTGVDGRRERLDNGEVYLGLSWGPLSAKVQRALTDYFGLADNTTNFYVVPAANGSSRGTMVYSLAFSQELAPALTLNAALGHTRFARYGVLDYSDWRVGASYQLHGLTLGASVVGTSGLGTAGKAFYSATDGVGKTHKLYATRFLVSVGATF
jgi:uncharacterized protein (TIGR02001 family)